ncbi:jg2150, partial [Pararge aegeria aegeria]
GAPAWRARAPRVSNGGSSTAGVIRDAAVVEAVGVLQMLLLQSRLACFVLPCRPAPAGLEPFCAACGIQK